MHLKFTFNSFLEFSNNHTRTILLESQNEIISIPYLEYFFKYKIIC